MYTNKTGMQRGQDFRQGRTARRGNDPCIEQCMEQCCNPQPHLPQWTERSKNQRARNYQDPLFRPPGGGNQMRYRPQEQFQGRSMADRQRQYMDPYMYSSPYSSPRRVPSYDQYDSLFVNQPSEDPCRDLENGQRMAGDWSGFSGSPWSSSKLDDPSCKDWTNMGNDNNPFSRGYANSSLLGNNSMRASPACPNPQLHQSYTEGCSLKHVNTPMGLLTRFMNIIRPPPPKCPLKPLASKVHTNKTGVVGSPNSCFRSLGSTKHPEDHFDSLDDLWNPRKIRRWGCVHNWDQHKESLWKQVIENKMGSCGPAGRSVEHKVHEALDALHQEGADCIAFRMFYGILKRNEDVYLNPYLQLMTDEEFLKLIIALNNFYFEDKDKRKEFLDHPPPTWIEKIMQKETLAILDPASRAPSIVRRFWEVLLDWYIHKLVEKGDPSAQCTTDKTPSQNSFGNF